MAELMECGASRLERERVRTAGVGPNAGLGRKRPKRAAHGGSVAALASLAQLFGGSGDGEREDRYFGPALASPIKVLLTALVLSLMSVEFTKLMF
ncbi:MAG: hypothetical protein AAF416_08455 [Pseudomonadota bacterium]